MPIASKVQAPAKASGALLVDSPYVPPTALVSALEAAPVFAEIYPAKPNEVQAALGRALRGEPPVDSVVALLLPGKLFLSVAGEARELPELSLQTSRKGTPVEYGEQCGDAPASGDRLEAAYTIEGANLGVTMDLRVVRHLAFSGTSEEPLDLDKPGACETETHSRTFYAGQMTLTHAGGVTQRVPVLMQSIYEP